MTIEPQVVDVLLSRLLHDLIGPVTATVNGIELVEEYGAAEDDGLGREALDLVGQSARQTADRLGLFRLAFGAAGNSADCRYAQIEEMARPYLVSRRIDLDCSGAPEGAGKAPVGIVKATLAAVILLADSLPRGGRLSVAMGPEVSSPVHLAALGDGARLEDISAGSLTGEAVSGEHTTRTVVAALVAGAARRFGHAIALRAETGRVEITLTPKA